MNTWVGVDDTSAGWASVHRAQGRTRAQVIVGPEAERSVVSWRTVTDTGQEPALRFRL